MDEEDKCTLLGGWKRLSDAACEEVVGSTSPVTKGNEEEYETRMYGMYVCLSMYVAMMYVIDVIYRV